MANKEDYRIFVGGLSWNVTERQLQNAFSRFGKILEAQVMMERNTGRPRGFGFITFADRRGMDDAIREMHGQELGDRNISVNKAQPRMGGDDGDYRGGGLPSGGRKSSFDGGDRYAGQDDCFKCGRPGHWARDCPMANGSRGEGRFGNRLGGGGGGVGYVDRLGGGDRDRYFDDRYDERDRFDTRDSRFVSRDRYGSDRYESSDRYGRDRYAVAERYPQNGYDKERDFDRDFDPRVSDRYGVGGPDRMEGRSYRTRPAPYDRPSRGRPRSFDRY